MKKKISFVLFLLMGLLGCGNKDAYSISVKQLEEKIHSGSTDFVMVDVRTPDELKGSLGRIDGVINIPLQDLDSRESELEKYKDKEIIFICRSGRRSGIAAKNFEARGYKVRSLDGGMQEYRAEMGEK